MHSALLVDFVYRANHTYIMFTPSKRYLLIAFFILLLILLVNLSWIYYYDKTEKIIEEQLDRRLTAIATIASDQLKSINLHDLRDGELEALLSANDILITLQKADSLAELFIVDEEYNNLASSVDESDSIYILADINAQYIDSLFFTEYTKPLITPSIHSGSLVLKSCFIPLLDENLFTQAVLSVEANVDYSVVLSEVRQNLIYSSSASLIGGLILGLLFFILQKRINKTEQNLYQAQTQAYLGRMVAVVSHEIKNPLMIIRASAERLIKKTEIDEARYVIEEIDRLNNIVTGYLNFAKSGSSLLAFESLIEVKISELVSYLKNQIEKKFQSHSINWLDKNLPNITDITTVKMYDRSIRQVLLNLLINAADASILAKNQIEIGIKYEVIDKKLIFVIEDHGHGMSQKEQSQAFEPFQTTKQSGSGLGLFLSRKIIEEMNGKLQIVSSDKNGTKVKVTIPEVIGR